MQPLRGTALQASIFAVRVRPPKPPQGKIPGVFRGRASTTTRPVATREAPLPAGPCARGWVGRGAARSLQRFVEADTLDARNAAEAFRSAKPLLRRAASESTARTCERAGFPTPTHSGASERVARRRELTSCARPEGRTAAGDQTVGPAPEHRAEMPPQLLAMVAADRQGETVSRLFTKTEGFTAGCSRSSGWRSGSPLNSPRSQPQHSRRPAVLRQRRCYCGSRSER